VNLSGSVHQGLIFLLGSKKILDQKFGLFLVRALVKDLLATDLPLEIMFGIGFAIL
jgi:hypothetical protein